MHPLHLIFDREPSFPPQTLPNLHTEIILQNSELELNQPHYKRYKFPSDA
jgi:hypothetical protein